MMDLIKKYWWCYLFIIIVIPIGVNFLLLIPRFTPIVGNSIDWLRFWSSYLGVIIAIIVPSAVCYYSLKENRKARKEQIKKESLQEYKNVCLSCGITYLPKCIFEILSFCSDLNEIQKTLKEHQQKVLQNHLIFLMHYDLATDNIKSLESKCFTWHTDFLSDSFAIIKGILLLKDKELLKKYLTTHIFHKSIPKIDTIIDEEYNQDKSLFTLILLGNLHKQYLADCNSFYGLYAAINESVKFDTQLSTQIQ